MKNLDSLTLKFFYEENKSFLQNGVIQKIQMPTRTEILFYIRNSGENRKFYININPKFPHICFINDKNDYSIKIPKSPPMFCMQLRKYLEGAKILNCSLVEYDRILEFYFSIYDEFGSLTEMVLAIELMGKYSNVILYNQRTKIIIGSCHNVSSDKSSIREIYGGIKYIYPKKQEKLDILRVSYANFIENSDDIPKKFFYFSNPFFEFLKTKEGNLFENLQKAILEPNLIKEFWNLDGNFNEIIFKYFSKIVNEDNLKSKKAKLLKVVSPKLKNILKVFEEEIDLDKFERYKKSGDLIFQYIYMIEQGTKSVELEGNLIKLDINLSLAQNAQKYYKLYSKLKSAKSFLEKRKQEAKEKKEYYEEIIFSIENASNLGELEEIEEEILPDNKKSPKKPVLTPIDFMGFQIYIGKNNKQNDYLIRKIASSEDIWLHAQNCPSSHCIIKAKNDKKEIPNEVILKGARLVKENSKMKNSTKASIIYTKRKFLKRPPNTHLGYVTYREEKEIVI